MKTLRSDYLRQIKRKLTVYVAFDSFFFLWIDSLHKIIKNLKATTWLSHFWMYPFSPLILSMLRKFEHLLSIYYQSWKTMFLAERDIKLDIKLDIKFVLDRGVSGGLERVLHSASAAYILS